jgi:hypothetical protein
MVIQEKERINAVDGGSGHGTARHQVGDVIAHCVVDAAYGSKGHAFQVTKPRDLSALHRKRNSAIPPNSAPRQRSYQWRGGLSLPPIRDKVTEGCTDHPGAIPQEIQCSMRSLALFD